MHLPIHQNDTAVEVSEINKTKDSIEPPPLTNVQDPKNIYLIGGIFTCVVLIVSIWIVCKYFTNRTVPRHHSNRMRERRRRQRRRHGHRYTPADWRTPRPSRHSPETTSLSKVHIPMQIRINKARNISLVPGTPSLMAITEV